jgi:hypothetical protein
MHARVVQGFVWPCQLIRANTSSSPLSLNTRHAVVKAVSEWPFSTLFWWAESVEMGDAHIEEKAGKITGYETEARLYTTAYNKAGPIHFGNS